MTRSALIDETPNQRSKTAANPGAKVQAVRGGILEPGASTHQWAS
jgi:hypothetical protein